MVPGSLGGECDDVGASSGAEFEGPGDCSVLLLADWFARAREAGRERDLSARAGDEEGEAGMFSGAIVGTDILRSCGNAPGGGMARLGS